MALTAQQIDEQKKQVEELIAGADVGFAKALFYGKFKGDLLFPYPVLPPAQQKESDDAAAKVRDFADKHIDHMQIDKDSEIPQSVIDGLAKIDVYKMTIPKEYGGLGFGQQQYLKTMEILGGHCASTAVFVNAHHSIGCRALCLFGSKEQQATWLPALLDGKKLCAFALTEPEAGSDAGGVRMTATPTEDGKAFLLNGIKHYITNGGIADILTVMARTTMPDGKSKVTAFLVTPDMPGFTVLEKRAPKCGIRGTATGKMQFTNVRVPKENVLGEMGRGLQAALTVLNYGRVTFGATCTGHAKVCLEAMTKHAKSRKQFQQSLSEFEMVKKKIAFAAAHTFAMEAATAQCAAFIDKGSEDYMLETAILKIFATEHLWTVVNDCLQVYGGKGYFSDQPVERWMRDARINLIGEGANDVLKAFVAVVGCRGPGEFLKGLRDDMLGGRWSLKKLGQSLGVAGKLAAPWLTTGTPEVPVKHPSLKDEAERLGRMTRDFGLKLPKVFMALKDEAKFVQAQLVHERLADIAIDLYVSACTLARIDYLLTKGETKGDPFADVKAGLHFMNIAHRRMKERFDALDENDDVEVNTVADAVIGKF